MVATSRRTRMPRPSPGGGNSSGFGGRVRRCATGTRKPLASRSMTRQLRVWSLRAFSRLSLNWRINLGSAGRGAFPARASLWPRGPATEHCTTSREKTSGLCVYSTHLAPRQTAGSPVAALGELEPRHQDAVWPITPCRQSERAQISQGPNSSS